MNLLISISSFLFFVFFHMMGLFPNPPIPPLLKGSSSSSFLKYVPVANFNFEKSMPPIRLFLLNDFIYSLSSFYTKLCSFYLCYLLFIP